jgi:rhomboid protease GluP
MPIPDSSSDYEVSERLLAIARFLGIGEIRARWKIIAAQRWWRRLRQDLAPASRRFDRQVCQSCGALQAKSLDTCGACGERTGSRAGSALRALGLSIPTAISVSSALGVAMVAIYARMMIARPGEGYFSWDVPTLIAFGGHYPPAVHAGQWWRLGTAMFLHIGLVHLGFNLLALAQIGPSIEDIFGRGRMLFFFLLTGVLANVGSELWGLDTVSAGASGAIMGLIGVAAGWGQRTGTAHGREVRNQMLKWAAYTMFFGVAVNADNAAHGFGFASGALLGYSFNPFRLQAAKGNNVNAIMAAAGALAAAALTFLCLAPPASSHAAGARIAAEDDQDDEPRVPEELDALLGFDSELGPACALLDAEKVDEAIARARADAPKIPFPPEKEAATGYLKGLCGARAGMESLCARIKKDGIDSVIGPEATEDPRYRDAVAASYKAMCASLERR